jgi:hypothetical protein
VDHLLFHYEVVVPYGVPPSVVLGRLGLCLNE